ncbi:MAG TPA: hypothetical protein DCR87_04365 [Acidobacteria bacterium]|nr:hypothetical protein [Acidobacteriota bacterium]
MGGILAADLSAVPVITHFFFAEFPLGSHDDLVGGLTVAAEVASDFPEKTGPGYLQKLRFLQVFNSQVKRWR